MSSTRILVRNSLSSLFGTTWALDANGTHPERPPGSTKASACNVPPWGAGGRGQPDRFWVCCFSSNSVPRPFTQRSTLLMPACAAASLCAGTLKSVWANGGAFIQFSGVPEGSRREDTFLANVTEAVPANSTRIPVRVCKREGGIEREQGGEVSRAACAAPHGTARRLQHTRGTGGAARLVSFSFHSCFVYL